MHIEVETNGTGSEVDVNPFLSSTFCLLTLYPHMTVAKHSKLSSGLIQIEHPPSRVAILNAYCPYVQYLMEK